MEYEAWIKKAEEDFDTANFNFGGNKTDAGLFYLQQAAEKALKALCIKKRRELAKTHDLVLLSPSLSAPDSIVNLCTLLTPLYQQTSILMHFRKMLVIQLMNSFSQLRRF